METEDLKEKVEDLSSHVTDYLDTFYRLTVLKATQKATSISSFFVVAIVLSTFGLFILFFASFGAAWWLGDLIKSRAGGFMIIAGFYFLIVLFIILLRKKVVLPFIRNLIIGKIYE